MSDVDRPSSPVGRVEVELGRVLTRLAALGPARLARPGGDGSSAADVVRPLLQHLADVSADAEGGPRRRVPVLGAHALGDQLVVLVRDVLSAAPGDADGRVADVADRLTALRRTLP